MFVCVILCKCTVSNAFDMPSAIAIVFSGGFFLLKPVVIVVFVCRAVIVKRLSKYGHQWSNCRYQHTQDYGPSGAENLAVVGMAKFEIPGSGLTLVIRFLINLPNWVVFIFYVTIQSLVRSIFNVCIILSKIKWHSFLAILCIRDH